MQKATYDNALDSGKLRAHRTNATYFIYHQPETWEDREAHNSLTIVVSAVIIRTSPTVPGARITI